MMRLLITIITLCSLQQLLIAQDSIQLTKNFQFEDGVYKSFEALKNNKPTFLLSDFYVKKHPANQYDSKRFELTDALTRKRLLAKDVFAVCIDGEPFINYDYNRETLMPDYGIIVNRLTTRGKFCMFVYEDYRSEADPLGLASRPYYVLRKMVLNFETGHIFEFNPASFVRNIKDDEPLQKAIKDLEKTAAQNKLYKCLLIYNDRHPVYVQTKNTDNISN